MTSSDHWTHRLSEYLDDELAEGERAACRAHLDECAGCAAVLEELRAVVDGAANLPDHLPERDLWEGIESRLLPRGALADGGVIPMARRTSDDGRRRLVVSVPQLIAAAVALVVLSAGSVWLLVPGSASAPSMAGPSEEVVPAEAPSTAAPVAFAAAYEQAISELELELEQRRALLDPETVRVVEENLAIIDGAIGEANEALARDPSSGFLQTHLASAMRQKVDLLRRVTAIEQKGT